MLPAIIIYISFAISAVMGGISLGIYVLGIAMILLSFFVFYQYLRTKHFGSLISTIYLVIFGSFCISIHPYYEIGERLHMTQTSAILFVFAMILLVWLVYLNVTRKLKWRGREILELAAQNITDTYNNHTERPLPTGNVDFSREELYNFSKFFEKNLLGLTYKEDNRIVFMPLKYKNEYGVDGIMIGRAAIGYPWIFNEIKHFAKTGLHLEKPGVAERVDAAIQHLEMSVKWKGEILGVAEMKRHYTNYFKGIYDFKQTRMKLVTSYDLDEIMDTLNYIKENSDKYSFA